MAKKASINRKANQKLRHARILKRLKREGNLKPRLIVSKTNCNLYAQIFDDQTGKVLAAYSTLNLKQPANLASATKVGTEIAARATKLNIKAVTFDRGGNKYHGLVQALADAARAGGLEF
ncbi:MAG: 50S ribosomal protein L18 [Mycoplasmataceae bacterium]|jgi:large subunit ribosomal protein L18|nr:50S ribosomal protein L18 [Mycoplasmataceae bacterium]